ncbi:hypothetical protein ACF0H5_005145 [Mactra antiquata]
MAAAMVRQHSGHRFRSGRFRGRHGSGEDNVQLDFTKDPIENVKEILKYAIKQHAFSKAKKLGYLNAFVKLINKCGGITELGFPLRSILICLSVNLLQAPKEVRAGTLRVIKHLVTDEESLNVLLDLHLDYLIVRSADMCLDNEIERIHAQKLIRKFSSDVPLSMPRSLIQPLVAIGNDGTSERDKMVRASLACICELTYTNPDLVAHCGGISMLLRKILDCHQYPRINESIVSTILHLVNFPSTRHFVQFNTDLEQLMAPFTDIHFSFTGENTDQTSEDIEARFAASKMAIVTVMRSWPGIIRFCRPDGTGLQSIVGILYLPFKEIRQGIVELIFELFQLTLPEWTTDFNEALVSIDPSKMNENWHLTEGFVANEGKTLLPHLATARPNLVENHLALLLSAWIGAGILDSLVEVVITSENEFFIRVVILLGNLLHLANKLLPPECCHYSHYLPSLMALASSFDIPASQRQQASLAVSYLDRIHALKKRGHIPCSLYLDQLIKQSGSYKDRPLSLNMQKDKLLDMHIRKRASSSEEVCMHTLKDTNVLNTKEDKSWDWDLIMYVLKWPDDKLRKLEDQIHVRFIKRLAFFYKPTNHLFSRVENEHPLQRKFALAGCHLVDFLVRCEQDEGTKILNDFLSDIALCLSEVALQRIAPESVLSANKILNTLSHYYFLFIGRFSLTSKGDRKLEKAGIYQYLLDIISSAPQETYVKLITSSLYYGREGNSRAVLSKALCAGPESGRLYSTKLMRVLLRAKIEGFTQWGIEYLVNQLYDQSKCVAMSALTILDEACEIKENLEAIVKMKPSFLHLGEKGVMILCRYMSTPAGFTFLTEANYTTNELKKWHESFNSRYVKIVEELLNEALTTYEKTYEGSYTRRSSKQRQKKDLYVPTHLFGQLVQHQDGFKLLKRQLFIDEYFQCIRCQELKNDEDILQLKTTLWAVGHMSMSSWGVAWLQEERIVPEIIRLAEESAIYSIRGTAFFILGMISSTREGAEVLSQFGWESRWNTRAENWPLVEDRSVLLEEAMEDLRENVGFSIDGNRLELGSPVSNLDFIAEEGFKAYSSEKVRFGNDDGSDDNDENGDSESGIHIPDIRHIKHSYSPDLRGAGLRLKSQTLPLPGHSIIRSQTLPNRSRTFRSVAINSFRDHHTKSVEHLSPTKDVIISRDHRSLSMNLDLKNSKNSDQHISVINEKKSSARMNSEPSDVNSVSKDLKSDNDTNEIGDQVDSGVVMNRVESTTEDDEDASEVVLKIVEPSEKVAKSESVDEANSAITESSTIETESLTTEEKVSTIEINVTDTEGKIVEKGENMEHKVDVDKSTVDVDQDKNVNNSVETVSENKKDSPSDKVDETNDTETKIVVKKVVSLKFDRSSSCDSARTTKSHTESFGTDSVTSGIGSYDSGHHGVVELPSLSPIPSTNSLDTTEGQSRNKEKKESLEHHHHSVVLRRMSNLSRVPSVRRQSSTGFPSQSLSKFDFSDNAVTYTTARDAMGYATLRSLMKNRTISSDLESDYGLNTLYDNMGSMSSINRRPSIDSTEIRRPGSIMYNMSGLSLSDMDGNLLHPPKASLYQHRPHTGKAEFMGITLPVDINMMFEVHEGEDRRTESFIGRGISRQTSVISQCTSISRQASCTDTTRDRSDSTDYISINEGKSTQSSKMSDYIVLPTPLSSAHNVDICIKCRGIRQESSLIHPIDESESSTDKVESTTQMKSTSRNVNVTTSRSRADSNTTDNNIDTSDSLTSTASDSSAGKKMSFETAIGRTLVRKEIIRFVINLSSSVGVKGAEQGLLSLKQKFPKAFQDLCFYSEVSFMLGNCSFRLTARRFIQELFEDIDISKILSEAQTILGVEDTEDKQSRVDRSVPEDFDGFEEFS